MAFRPWHIREVQWLDNFVLVTKDDERIRIQKTGPLDRWKIVRTSDNVVLEQDISTHTLWRYLNDFEALIP